jgi:hypothetical protein
MIQPNELRIGNYLNSRKGYTKVVGVLCDMIETETHSDILDNFDPIPITPEILERLGFVLKDSYWTHKDIIYGVVFMGANIEVCFSLHGVITAIPHLPLNELHRFQNIIHSLSGIELTFKTN